MTAAARPQCLSVLLKQVQRQLLSADECRALLADVLQLPLRPPSSSELACAALDQAMALALKHSAALITADNQLAKAAASLWWASGATGSVAASASG